MKRPGIKFMHKILYIDDNKSLTKLFKMLAEEKYYIPIIAHDYISGYEIAIETSPDVILMDIHMQKGLSGFDLTAQFKTDPRLSSIPIIGCSVSYKEDGKKLALLGGYKFINEKPTSLEKLNKILEGVLSPVC